MRFGRYKGFSIIDQWFYYRKSLIFENLTRYTTPLHKNRVLDIFAMVIKSRNYGTKCIKFHAMFYNDKISQCFQEYKN